MALPKMNSGVNDDDDEQDLEALRNAALQTLRKTCPPPSSDSGSVGQTQSAAQSNVLKTRGVPTMRGRGKRGNRHGGPFRGNNHGNSHGFFHNAKHTHHNRAPLNSNPNLITIVPQALPGEEDNSKPEVAKEFKSVPILVRPQDAYMNKNVILKSEPKTNGVFTKFSRLKEDSDSDESSGEEQNEDDGDSDNETLKDVAEAKSVSDDEDKVTDEKIASDSEKDTDIMTIKADEDDEDSLERLIQKLDDEINKPAGVVPVTPDTPKQEAVTLKPKKEKFRKQRDEDAEMKVSMPKEEQVSISNLQPIKQEPLTPPSSHQTTSMPIKLEKLTPPRQEAEDTVTVKSVTPVKQDRSPPQRQSPVKSRSPVRLRSPLQDRSLSPVSDARSRSSPRGRSPLRLRSPPRARSRSRSRSRSRPRSPRRRSPLAARPLRRSPSPWASRSPQRSPRRSPYRVRSPYRARSRSPRRSRSPHPHSPLREVSPGRQRTPIRSRSPVRARSPPRMRSPRRSRSPGRSPRWSRSPIRLGSPLRRRSPYKRSPPRLTGGPVRSPGKWRSSRSRSPPPQLPRQYARSRTRSPPRRRSRTPSPGRHFASRLRPRSPMKSRSRSPAKRRSKSPPRVYSPTRRKSLSPRARRRSLSPRRSPGRRYLKKSPTSQSTWSPNAARSARSPVRRLTPPSSNVESGRSPRLEQRASPVRNRSPVPKFRSRKSLSPRAAGSPAAQAHLSPSVHVSRKRSPQTDKSPSPAQKQRSPSLSLSPSPDRKEISPLRILSRRSEGFEDKKWARSEGKRRRSRPEDGEPTAAKQKRRSKKEKKKKKEKSSKKSEESILEARRRKFESKELVEVGVKKIRLKTSPSKEEVKETKLEKPSASNSLNPFEEYVDESILDAEFGELYSSDEEVDKEQKAESVTSSKDSQEERQTVSFTCTMNPSSSGSEKENSVHGGDSPGDCETPGSMERPDPIPNFEEEEAERRPMTNWELKEMVLKVSKDTDRSKKSKRRVTGGNSSDVDLRAELSRRRAERMNKAGSLRDMVPSTRLVQSAFKEVGVKTRVNGRISPDDRENKGGEGRRVMLVKRKPDRLVTCDASFSIVAPKDSRIEQMSSSIKSKVPIHMRLGLGNGLLEERTGRERSRERREHREHKMKLKRNITLSRRKQV